MPRLSLRERHIGEGAGESVREEWVDIQREGTERFYIPAQRTCSKCKAN